MKSAPSIDSSPQTATAPAAAQTTQKPKVLHIIRDKKVGGVKSTLFGLVNSHLSEDFDFTVLVADIDQPAWWSWRAKPEVVIWHHPCRFMELPRLALLKLLNPVGKIIIHEHGYSQGYEQFNVKAKGRFHWMLRLFFAQVDRVVAISQAQGDWMLQHHLVDPKKLTMITQCPPLERFFAVPSRSIAPPTAAQPLKLAAYGRFCFHKGFDLLLQALRLIPDLPIKVYLAGEGEQEAELKQLAQGLNTVEFVGRVDDVPGFLQKCDGVIIPSRWEPWGNVCIESKAAGKPVIVCSVDGLTEQVQDCGLLVEPNSPEQLAAAIANFVQQSPEQLMTWGENGRRSVENSDQRYFAAWQKFLWETIAR
jgi:glycosyltransferase involved in cell wall biosynthesis